MQVCSDGALPTGTLSTRRKAALGPDWWEDSLGPDRHLTVPDVWASRFKKIRGGEVGELEKWNGSHAVERHTRGERQMESLETSLPSGSMAMVARKRLTREVYLPRETMAKSRPGCYQEPCVGLWSYSSQGLC